MLDVGSWKLDIQPPTSNLQSPIWSQRLRSPDVYVRDFILPLVCVPVDENPDAPFQAARHGYLLGAEEGHVSPANLPRCLGWERRRQVGCGSEDGAGHVFCLQIVSLDDELQELPGGSQNCLGRVPLYSSCSSNTATSHHFSFLSARPPSPPMLGGVQFGGINKKAWACLLHAFEIPMNCYDLRMRCPPGVKQLA